MPIIQQALLQPEIWGRQSPLWNHRFLPTVNGKPMTIRRALALLRRGRLLYFTGQNPLVEALSHGRVPILDLCQDCFAPLSVLTSRRHKPGSHIPAAAAALAGCRKDTMDDLLAAVNARLTKE